MTDCSFQITLPSNASSKLFSSNRANSFRTKLCKTLELGNSSPDSSGDWEVALVDIQFPENWPNVLESTEIDVILQYPVAVPQATSGTAQENEKEEEEDTVATIAAENTSLTDNQLERFPAAPTPPALSAADDDDDVDDDYERGTDSDPYSDTSDQFLFSFTVPRGYYMGVRALGEFMLLQYHQALTAWKNSIRGAQTVALPQGITYALRFQFARFTQQARIFQYGSERALTIGGALGGGASDGAAKSMPDRSVSIKFCTKSPYLLHDIFGFQCETKNMENSTPSDSRLYYFRVPMRSKRTCNLELLTSIFVYSNIVKYQLVGDTEAPLLGIVPINFSSESTVLSASHETRQQYYTFNPPYYIPLITTQFDIIEIQLNTDWGSPFPFKDDPNSKVICRLDFRKRIRGSRFPIIL